MNIRLYQINLHRDKNRVAFESLERMRTYSGEDWPDGSIYDLVFEGSVQVHEQTALEALFAMFNTDAELIQRSTGRSMCVSDIVEFPLPMKIGEQISRFWYCDPVGFKPVMFDAGQTRKAASAATETARK